VLFLRRNCAGNNSVTDVTLLAKESILTRGLPQWEKQEMQEMFKCPCAFEAFAPVVRGVVRKLEQGFQFS